MSKFWEIWDYVWSNIWCPSTRIEVLMTLSGETAGYRAQYCYDEWGDRYASINKERYSTLEEAKKVVSDWRKNWIETRFKELQKERKRYIEYP